MSNLVLNSDTLQVAADIIDAYADRQKEVMEKFVRNVSNLGGGWRDDETFCSLIREILKLESDIHIKMDVVGVYANIFRQRAEAIERRPKFGQSSGVSSVGSSAMVGSTDSASTLAQRRQYSSIDKIMQKNRLSITQLHSDICQADGVGNIDGYVNTSTNQTKINDLEYSGRFLSPATGEPIYAKKIAYRGYGICTPNAQNVCGAEFYYKDGTFCGSYTGKSWQDIFDLNYSDTKSFRK